MMIRPATAEDATAIAAIQNREIRETATTFNSRERSRDEVVDLVRTRPCFLVAEDGDKIFGFALYSQFRGGPGYARTMEHTIVLAPEGRGKGVGRALMRELEDHAGRAGVGSLWAGISGENPAGVAFHSRLGFEEVARLPKVGFKFGRWMDLVLMRKWLQERE